MAQELATAKAVLLDSTTSKVALIVLLVIHEMELEPLEMAPEQAAAYHAQTHISCDTLTHQRTESRIEAISFTETLVRIYASPETVHVKLAVVAAPISA